MKVFKTSFADWSFRKLKYYSLFTAKMWLSVLQDNYYENLSSSLYNVLVFSNFQKYWTQSCFSWSYRNLLIVNTIWNISIYQIDLNIIFRYKVVFKGILDCCLLWETLLNWLTLDFWCSFKSVSISKISREGWKWHMKHPCI